MKTAKIETAPFDAADYLDSVEMMAEYLNAAMQDGDADLFLTAIKDVARAGHDAASKGFWPRPRESLQSTSARRKAAF
jgi:DNA-binding phage protein